MAGSPTARVRRQGGPGCKKVRADHALRGEGSYFPPGGLALLGEGGHAFLLILGGEEQVEGASLEEDAFGQRTLEGAVDGLLGHAAPLVLCRQSRQPARLSSRNDAAGKARLTSPNCSLLRRDAPPVRDHVHGDRLADGARQPLRATCAGMMPRLISGWPNCAVSEATMRSQIMANSQPPPRQ